jgi:hypothetical protein
MGKDEFLDKVSPEYYTALEDSKKLHSATNKFSGKFLRPHAKSIKDIIEAQEVKSILDYGCGKGLQYQWVIPDNAPIEQWIGEESKLGTNVVPSGKTLEQYWGIEVTKYDPAVPEFSKEPRGSFDLVLVSHVLGTIPVQDLPIIVERIFSLTNKYVYVIEAIGAPKKQWASGETEFPVGWTTMQWIDVLAPLKPVHLICELCVRYRSAVGSHLGRFKL